MQVNWQMLQPVPRETRAGQVYQAIVRYVLQTGLELGSRLPSERKFSEVLGVSRTVVRAALSQLAEEGYLEKRAGAGVILTRRPPPLTVATGLSFDPSNVPLQDLYHARITVEIGAVEWVVRGMTEQLMTRLEDITDEIAERVKANAPIVQQDREFHVTLIQACTNPVILQFAGIIELYFDRMRFAYPDLINRSRVNMMDVRHRMILMALQTHDVEATRQALRLHFLPLRDDARTVAIDPQHLHEASNKAGAPQSQTPDSESTSGE
jgi:GntR family transcriptional regulator, transcriptional repressor for pyruvate dehydrogenase complex